MLLNILNNIENLIVFRLWLIKISERSIYKKKQTIKIFEFSLLLKSWFKYLNYFVLK